jgi:hypothetical protein
MDIEVVNIGGENLGHIDGVMIDLATGSGAHCGRNLRTGRMGQAVRVYGTGHPMIGTALMLFFGLPSITRSLYAT